MPNKIKNNKRTINRLYLLIVLIKLINKLIRKITTEIRKITTEIRKFIRKFRTKIKKFTTTLYALWDVLTSVTWDILTFGTIFGIALTFVIFVIFEYLK
jgi:hypothetical protein